MPLFIPEDEGTPSTIAPARAPSRSFITVTVAVPVDPVH